MLKHHWKYAASSALFQYMESLLCESQAFEIFIEAGRTRSGKALHPKGGLLSVAMDTFTAGWSAQAAYDAYNNWPVLHPELYPHLGLGADVI